MDRWIDTLSEEWVSQPRSSSPSSLPNGSPTVSSDTSSPLNGSRSRIPRPKLRTHSTSVLQSGSSKGSGIRAESDQRNGRILGERSSSRLNVHSPRSQKDTRKPDAKLPSPRNSLRNSRTLSESSLQSVIHNTVQHKGSSSSNGGQQRFETPQWKRRVLQGEMGYGEQRDLFSPMGLESIFHPGAAPPRPQPKTSRTFDCVRDSELPSSPPQCDSSVKPLSKGSDAGQGHVEQGASQTLEKDEGEYDPSRKGSPEQVVQPGNPSDTGAASKNESCGYGSALCPIHHTNDHSGDWTSKSPQDHGGCNRTVSGHEDSRNEKFSPVYVSRHNTVDGRIDYAALDPSYRQIKQPIEHSALHEGCRPTTRSSDHDVQYGHPDSPGDIASPEHLSHDWTSHSLPGDLSTSTEVFAAKGGFVNFHRGGYSNDGSFLQRGLSPSSTPRFDSSDNNTIEMPGSRHDKCRNHAPPLHGPGSSVKRQHPSTVTETPAAPKPPTMGPGHAGVIEAKQGSSGSPLKLFGGYDTFTNNRLLRRMGQFEGSSPISTNEQEARLETAGSLTSGIIDGSLTIRGVPEQTSRMSSFGNGDLHGFEFEEEISITSSQPISQHNGTGSQSALVEPDHGAELRLAIHLGNSPEISSGRKYRRTTSKQTSTRTSCQTTRRWVAKVQTATAQSTTDEITQQTEGLHEKREVEGQLKSKRPPNSPAKDPAPKRRRTYDNESGDIVSADVQSVEQRSQQMQSIIGRKRKDARYDVNGQEADPKVLALRQMLRPRTPTPNRHRQRTREAGATEVSESIARSSREQNKLDPEGSLAEGVTRDLDAQTTAVAAELANFAIHAAQNVASDSRKPSITTQDFLNEATKVMNIIRSKGKPPSGLGSIEQSEEEDAEIDQQTYDEQSTKDEFSRPPSREGGSLRLLRAPKQLDARVLSHLRKFEEKDDIGDVITSSFKSLTIDGNGDRYIRTTSSEVAIESEPSNIRIIERA